MTLLYKTAFRKVESVFFENEVNAEEFRKRKIISEGKQRILRGAGVNLEYYSQQPYPAGNSEGRPVRFLYLGRIMKEKGIDELFTAVRRLREDNNKFILD